MAALTASVVGGSGYTGGELLRLLYAHPDFEVVQATSRQYEPRTVGSVHPNLRDWDLRFSDPSELEPVDVLFAATPHGVTMGRIKAFDRAAELVVDLSADFRLDSDAAYEEWYDGHDAPEYLDRAQYALPELFRDELAGGTADILASGGCNATATLLALYPLFEAGILAGDERIVVDVKVGSSEGGAGGGAASSHAERSGWLEASPPPAPPSEEPTFTSTTIRSPPARTSCSNRG